MAYSQAGKGSGNCFHAFQQFRFAKQAGIQRFAHPGLVQILADKNKLLAHIAKRLLPFLHNEVPRLGVFWPALFGNGFPEYACGAVVGDAARLAPLASGLEGGSPARKSLLSALKEFLF